MEAPFYIGERARRRFQQGRDIYNTLSELGAIAGTGVSVANAVYQALPEFKRTRVSDEEPQQGVTRLEYRQDPYVISKRHRSTQYQIERQPTYKHYFKPLNRVYDFKMPKYGRRRYTRRRRAIPRYPRKMVTRRMPPTIQRRVFVNSGVGFPKQLKMIHRWAASGRITCTGGALSALQVKANSIYQPGDSFSVTTDPMYYDQMTPLYDHWVVVGALIKVTLNPNATSTAAVRWGIYLNDDTSMTPATVEGCITQGGAVSKLTGNTSEPGRDTTLRHKYSAKKEFGGSILANNSLQGTDAANPSEGQYWTIFAKPLVSIASLDYDFTIECQYIVIWKEAHDISMS